MLLRETERVNQASGGHAGCRSVFSLDRTRAGLLPFAFPGDSFNPMRHKEVMSN
jgi:hypothetical protein